MSPLLAPPGFAQRIRSKSENKHLALADRQFGKSLCTILSNSLCCETIDKADCKRIFQIGDRRVRSANFWTTFAERNSLCKAPPSQGGVAAPVTKRREATLAAQTGWSLTNPTSFVSAPLPHRASTYLRNHNGRSRRNVNRTSPAAQNRNPKSQNGPH